MRMKYESLISCFLIIGLLFSGMFYDSFREDSFMEKSLSVCVTEHHSNAVITEQNNVLTETALCTAEMLAARTIACIRQIENRAFQRVSLKPVFGCLYLQITSYIFSKQYFSVSDIPFLKLYGQTVLVTYIHNQDGKK